MKIDWRVSVTVVSFWVVCSFPASSQGVRDCGSTSVGLYRWVASGQIAKSNNCIGVSGFRCYPVEGSGSSIEKVTSSCNPVTTNCAVKIHATATIPGLRDMINEDGLTLTPRVEWYACPQAGCAVDNVCGLDAFGGRINFDNLDTWVERGLSCGEASSLNLSVKLRVCPSSSCESSVVINLPFTRLSQLLGCPNPRKWECKNCSLCIVGGGDGGCGASPAGKGLTCRAQGPGAHLYYAAGGGPGNPNLPGSAAWTPALGRNWSHDYAQRIIPDPDDSHVWLITPTATFREWSALSGGVYGTVSPSDEKRTLRRTAGGWDLAELDGTVHSFDSIGHWTRTTESNGNAKVAAYNGSGQLTQVSFPDGRFETFAYHPSGKLASINEVGLGGSPTRAWLYTWSGDDLVRIDRPDGTAWELFYDNAALPGYLTRWDLVGTDLVRRVEGAWEYDPQGNVAKMWRGDPVSTGPNAVELYAFSYDDPVQPSQTQVTDTLGKVTTYTIARDTVSDAPKAVQISGDCPVCGTGPNSQFTYGDLVNPLLPTQVIDGRGLITQFTYNANGQITSKTEAAGTPLARTTTWQYGNPSFPAFSTQMAMPSTSGGAAQRITTSSFDTSGNLITRTIQGAEGGSSFNFATASTFNAAGQPVTVDPPGFGTADQTSYSYDASRGNLFPLTRTDPLIGATAFAYDGLNRQTSVTDPNGVTTVTTYDNLSRVTAVTQKGATAADDLMTAYQYNSLGDLLRTVLPRGNLIEYGYDPAGRLTSIERKPNASTHGERTFYTLDAFGHRTKEELQRWNGTAWVTASFTDYVYSSHCHLDKTIQPGGSVTEFAYDCDGNLEKVWDANHPKASNPNPTQLYAYDELNRMKSVTQPWTGAGGGNAVTFYGYDVQDHLSQVTDAEGDVTTYTYGDRDLMTTQVSSVSGTTSYAYNEHGELTTEIDGRTITTTRTLDALDREIAMAYPNPALNVFYTFDDPAVAFSKGRLTRISRNLSATDYRYDRFGRLLQDGELSYGYDANGNPTSLVYPGGVEAVSTYDFADRPSTLLARRPGKPDQQLVTSSSYLPSGPLSSVTLGNGLTESHVFTNRYFPSSITLAGTGNVLSWSYTTDNVGNVLSIADSLNAANNRTYGYLDNLYFLTKGDGPWGTRSWAYDKIGNRLTEVHAGVTDTYTYQLVPPPGTGHTPLLAQIQLGAGGTRAYQFDPAGNLKKITSGADTLSLVTDEAGRLAALERPANSAGVSFRYDGRNFLAFADSEALPFQNGFESGDFCGWSGVVGLAQALTCPPPHAAAHPAYSSEGILHAVTRNHAPESSFVFRFASRPVAQLDLAGGVESWKFLTTDHLGTPIAATAVNKTPLWQGGLEPFGADWNVAGGAGVFLRFPGQWEDSSWASVGGGLYENVHRWYEAAIGRYSNSDPLWLRSGTHLYDYTFNNPMRYSDPLGLKPAEACGFTWVGFLGAVGDINNQVIFCAPCKCGPPKINGVTFGQQPPPPPGVEPPAGVAPVPSTPSLPLSTLDRCRCSGPAKIYVNVQTRRSLSILQFLFSARKVHLDFVCPRDGS